jgi:hypothetical protein
VSAVTIAATGGSGSSYGGVTGLSCTSGLPAGSTALTSGGQHTLTLPVSKAGKALLIAAREADRLQRKRQPRGRNPPKLALNIVFSLKPKLMPKGGLGDKQEW